MQENDSRVNGKVASDRGPPPSKPGSEVSHKLSPPLPWEPALPERPILSRRACDALAAEREKRQHYRHRLKRELEVHSPDWTYALVDAVKRARGICENCPPELEAELANGEYPLKRVVADWLEVAEIGLSRLLEAVEARKAAEARAAAAQTA